MSVTNLDKLNSSHHPSMGEVIVRNCLIGLLFVIALVALSLSRVFGSKGSAPLLKEAKQAAYATIGYAFKY